VRGTLKRRALGNFGVAIVVETLNGMLAVQADDFNVSRALLWHGEYDWAQVLWLASFLTGSSRVIFAGAHLGALLVPIARLAVPLGILAFEPSPRNWKLLSLNLRLNEVQRVQAFNCALGERSGSICFTENTTNTGNSHIDAAHGRLKVPLDTLDRQVPGDWDTIDLIVMDVEGSEVAALRGAGATLARTRLLYVEFAPEQLREQQASAAEFVELAERHFKSAYIFGERIQFLAPGEFGPHLRTRAGERGLLLNVLFTQDLECDQRRMIRPSNLTRA
jgi:FkbM family methyltransferase